MILRLQLRKILLVPLTFMLLPAWRSHVHVAINFQSFPSSPNSIMTIWECKKEKKKQAMIISEMLGVVVCCDGNTSAGPDTEKDIERNTKRVLPIGERFIRYRYFVRQTITSSLLFSHQSPPLSPGTCRLSRNLRSFKCRLILAGQAGKFPRSVACH